MRRGLALIPSALLVAAAPGDRAVGITAFDRLRVEGQLAVTVADGAPRARIEGDPTGEVELRSEGTTLTLRRRTAAGARADAAPVRVTLSTPSLGTILATAGAEVTAARLSGARGELSVGGAARIVVAAASTDLLNGVAFGPGELVLAGRTGTARLTAGAGGRIDAAALEAGDLVLNVEGTSDATARARYTAWVGNAGMGQVVVLGRPKCTVTGATDRIRCGVADLP